MSESHHTAGQRKMGDRIAIDGDYQHRALHQGNAVQRFWHQSKLQLISTVLQPGPSDSVLDIGCGSGVCSDFVGRTGASVLGIDGNPEAVRFAQQFYGAANVRFQLGFVDDLDLGGSRFNKAICLEVVEHLYLQQVDALLRGVAGRLEPGGTLLITTPNYRSAWPAIEYALDAFKLVPTLQEEQHVTKFHHASLRSCCEAAGFELVAARSVCTLGPWLAPVSPALAHRATAMELKRRIPLGTILAHLYRKS